MLGGVNRILRHNFFHKNSSDIFFRYNYIPYYLSVYSSHTSEAEILALLLTLEIVQISSATIVLELSARSGAGIEEKPDGYHRIRATNASILRLRTHCAYKTITDLTCRISTDT